MAQQIFPTKANLLAAKKSLTLARNGYELLDRKRNILIRETMGLMDAAGEIQRMIDSTYAQAYEALKMANITLGIIDDLSMAVPVEHGVNIDFRSIMGVEIPIVSMDNTSTENMNYYGYTRTNSMLDEAYVKFDTVKKLTIKLAEVENSVYRLAQGIKKTQKRANALKNIIIPRFEATVKFIAEALEEKDREEFSRMKIIKSGQNKS